MKILVVSDLHGSTRSGELIKKLDEINNFDKILILGDFLYNGARNIVPLDYYPKNLAESLNFLKNKIIAVRGNCDSDVDLMVLDYKITKMQIIKVEDYIFYLTHGDDDMIFNNLPNKSEIIIKGHTHVPLMYKTINNGIILNPGSMTLPKGSLDKSFIIIDEDDIKLYEFNYINNNSSDYKIKSIHSLKNKEYIK